MGDLANAAKRNSKWLLIEKEASVRGYYRGFRLVPNSRDPDLEVAQYKIETEAGIKFWENSNGKIMLFFDELPEGTLVQISRTKWINADGTEDTGKSRYEVVKINEETGEEEAWDE